ncbi:hypothetical protein ACKI1I_01740 [Streptomyces turgidiscabies]|nr:MULTISPECIES: hypothetical protein [Streptomyces]MDX3492380.1 hypothetical protein [Streptomyces turgidiscabies]
MSYLDTAAPAGTTSYYRVLVYGDDGDTPQQMGYGAVPGTRPATPASD